MQATEVTLRIISAIVIVLVGLALGLVLRRWLVRRLKKMVLDQWLTQVLGAISVVPMLLIETIPERGLAAELLEPVSKALTEPEII